VFKEDHTEILLGKLIKVGQVVSEEMTKAIFLFLVTTAIFEGGWTKDDQPNARTLLSKFG
jgi:hypothetical protein